MSSVQAPKMGGAARTEDPFGFAAREFLRDLVIGKKCEFHVEYEF
jgi:staphylococcal nuclease domain-containing protein 1